MVVVDWRPRGSSSEGDSDGDSDGAGHGERPVRGGGGGRRRVVAVEGEGALHFFESPPPPAESAEFSAGKRGWSAINYYSILFYSRGRNRKE